MANCLKNDVNVIPLIKSRSASAHIKLIILLCRKVMSGLIIVIMRIQPMLDIDVSACFLVLYQY